MAGAPTDPLERPEALVALDEQSASNRRMLVIVNPHATTVSRRLRSLVVYALHGRYDVHAVDTAARGHATDLCREAARDGYDVVVAFGGDGTVNEAANGLLGSRTVLSCLPGGRTNVYCRMLGTSTDVVDATERLLEMAHDWRPRRVDLGLVNGRAFLFSAGVGLDASVVEQVDAHPALKARGGPWYYAWTGVSTFAQRYLVRPPRLQVRAGGDQVEGVTAIVQNAAPYTYFGRRPVEMAEGASLDSGDLAAIVLRRSAPLELPTVTWRALSRGARVVHHRQIRALRGVHTLHVRSLDERQLPLQVDGDYIGQVREARFEVSPQALLVAA